MGVRRRAGATLAALVLALAACGGESPEGASDTAPSGTAPTPVETWDLGVEVDVRDMSTGLQSGSALLEHLRTEGDPQREAVRDAELISVWAGPSALVWDSDLNDCYVYPDGTRPPTRISRRDLAPFADMWRDILSEVVSLRDGRPTALRTRDIYNPVVPRHIAGGTAEACTRGLMTMSSIVRAETRRTGGEFVPVFRAFNGPDGLEDPRAQGMFEDAEHLSDTGVALLAQLHHDAGYAELLEK